MDKELKDMTPEELIAEVEGAREQLKKVNAESAGRRKELERIAAEEEEREKATLSETEKFQVEIKAISDAHRVLKAELDAERVRNAITTMAIELGFASPEDARALTDLSAIEVSKDGKVTGFEKSLKALAESGRLAMKDAKRSDGLGTPPSGGKPASGADKQEAPVIRL
jgi:hypothetical protein